MAKKLPVPNLELDGLRRKLERAERWAANNEQHGLMDTAAHEEVKSLRAHLSELGESQNGKSNASE